MAVFYDIVPLALTTSDDSDYAAKVKTQSATIEDVANAVLEDGNEYTKETLLAVYNHMEDAIRELVTSGHTVTTENIVYVPKIKGTFDKDGLWDSDANSYSCAVNPAQTFRQELAAVTPSFTGYVNASGGAQIETITDVTTGETSGALSAGGAVIVTGTKIKVTGDDSGLWFVTSDDNGEYDDDGTSYEVTLFAVNDPSKLVFSLPDELTSGTYYIVIKTRFASSGTLLKTVRTIVSDTAVTVG